MTIVWAGLKWLSGSDDADGRFCRRCRGLGYTCDSSADSAVALRRNVSRRLLGLGSNRSVALKAKPTLRCAKPTPFLEPEFVEDGTTWPERCEHRVNVSRKTSQRRAVRERSKQPLVLCGHGVLLRVEGGALTIRNGFTHYPQKQETYRFFKGELTIPPRIIMLDGSGSISFDVLTWLSEQNVPLIRIDWLGNVQSVLANNSYAANPYRIEWQRQTRADPRQWMAFCIDLIARKIDACIKTLEKSIRRSPAWEQAMKRLMPI